MGKTFADFAEAGVRWLDLGRSVVLRGDVGAGKSTVAAVIADTCAAGGTSVVRVSSWRDHAPLEAFAWQASEWGARAYESRSASLEHLYVEELAGGRALIVVDDIVDLTPESLRFLSSLLRSTRALLLCTIGREQLGVQVRSLLTTVRTATVELEPLGFSGIGEAMHRHLGGPMDAVLISAVGLRSAGVPAVATAIADAARFSGAIELREGAWVQVASLDTIPLDSICSLLTTTLSRREQRALEMLAMAGACPLSVAISLVGEEDLDTLSARGRVVVYPAADGALVSVSPPALAAGIQQTLSPVTRERAARAVAAQQPGRPAAVEPGAVEFTSEAAAPGKGALFTAVDLPALIATRRRSPRMEALGHWRAEHTLLSAVALLRTCIGQEADVDLTEVFQWVQPTAADSDALVTEFAMFQTQWALSAYSDSDDAAIPRTLELLDRDSRVAALVARLAAPAPGRVGFDRARTASWEPAALDRNDQSLGDLWADCYLALDALEAGHASKALDFVDGVSCERVPSQVARVLEVIRADALLISGDIEGLEAYSREGLEQAANALDPVGLRLHATTLGWALYLQRKDHEALEPLGLALRLGRPGPFIPNLYGRLLSIAAAAQLRLGNAQLAESLRAERQHHHLTLRPVFGGLEDWLEVRYSQDFVSAEEASAAAWRFAEDRFSRGYCVSALHILTENPLVLPPEHAHALLEHLADAPRTMFHAPLELHVASAIASPDEILERSTRVDARRFPWCVMVAVRALRERSAELADEAIAELENMEAQLRELGVMARPDVPLAMSEREREIAVLVLRGLTNRQIAEHLVVSTRTIENHVYRLLKKLRLDSRADITPDHLRQAQQPDPNRRDHR